MCIRDRIPAVEFPLLLAKIYKQRFGHELDWNNLQTYTEKMQWEKLFNKNPLKTLLTDKYIVRDWIKKRLERIF